MLDFFSVIPPRHQTVVWHWEPCAYQRPQIIAIWVISSQGPFWRLSMKFLECVDVTPSAGRYEIWIYLCTSTWHKHVLPLSTSVSNMLVPSLPISAATLSDFVAWLERKAGLPLRSASQQRVKRRNPISCVRCVCLLCTLSIVWRGASSSSRRCCRYLGTPRANPVEFHSQACNDASARVRMAKHGVSTATLSDASIPSCNWNIYMVRGQSVPSCAAEGKWTRCAQTERVMSSLKQQRTWRGPSAPADNPVINFLQCFP